MALKFFHRFEQQDLDATHDFSSGDTTGAHNGSPTYDPVAAKVGTNGLLIDAGGERTGFTTTSILSPTVGSLALWFQFPTAIPTTDAAWIFYSQGTNSNDYIRISTHSGGGPSNRNMRLGIRNNGGSTQNVDLDDFELAPGNWYFIVATWDSVTPSRSISIYDTSGTLMDTVSSVAAFTAPADLLNFFYGDVTGSTGTVYIKNGFIGDATADGDIFVTNRDITTYTAYDDGSGGTEATISNTSPQSIALTVNGRAATVNSFSTVTIREVFINEAGSPVQSRTGISLHVWYSGAPNGIADLSLSSLTTDANGTASWSLPTGGLSYNQAIFYVATDGGASLSEYTCARMTPIYN